MSRTTALVIVLMTGVAAVTAPTRADESGERVYAAIRNAPHSILSLGGAQIDVTFSDGAPTLDHARVLNWIQTSARAVIAYFGRFPVAHVGILVLAQDGAQIGSGVTFGYAGSAIRIAVGREADQSVFQNDWVLVHEMTHLALPNVPHRSGWLLEGNATYVEPIARVQAAQLDVRVPWRWALESMPKGLPSAADRGLDHTDSWGRTYWGGALFWLLADVKIRKQTDNRLGVQDALRAMNVRTGGNVSAYSVGALLAIGDEATRTTVLSTLYSQMKDAPVSTDLPALFRDLGVAEQRGKIVFDDSAPLAEIRRGITAARAPAG